MRLVVVGGVAAGLSAASRARRLDPNLEITVLEKGPVPSYGACGLPYYIEGQVRSLDDLVVYTPEFFRTKRNIEVRTECEVKEISHARREVSLANGERVRYDKLVIATGARPDTGTVRGDAFRLHTLADAHRLKQHLETARPRTAAVIGAGYIGLEIAEALRANGLQVRVLTATGDILGREDAWLTDTLRKHLEIFRVVLKCSAPVKDIETCSDDLVVAATGILPNAELAAAAGIRVGRTRAIEVSDRMETSIGGIYAAGDCAEVMHRVTGRPAFLPLGTTANKMGRVAGANAAGTLERFEGVVGTSIVRVCGLGVGITGLSEAQARREGFRPVSAIVTHPDKPGYFRGRKNTVQLVADSATGRLLGGTVLGDEGVAGRINVIATALTAKMTVDEFQQLDLAYSPPYGVVWDPLLIAAQQLAKL